MCILCATDLAGHGRFQRVQILQLLALLEDAGALPVDAALRIAGEILVLTKAEQAVRSCDMVNPAYENQTYLLKEPHDDC